MKPQIASFFVFGRRHVSRALFAALVLGKLGCATTATDVDAEVEAANLADPEGLLPPVPGAEDLDFHGELDRDSLAPLATGTTVGDVIAARSCSTSALRPLSIQIAEQMVCLKPTGFTGFAATSAISFTSSAVLPYLAPTALTALEAAAGSHELSVNSGFRTIAQQYTLYKWSLTKSCGITVAAKPGTSNHETGRAVDLDNYSAALGAMTSHGWSHDVAGDPVHFDYLHAADLRGLDITAFQTLWNQNHPTAKIAVSGKWDAATQTALAKAPVAGFATGAACSNPGGGGGWDEVVRADLDGDGNDELGFYTRRDGTFAWYPMTSDGQLGARLSSATIGTSWDIVLGIDADGDGADSVAFYDATSGAFAVYVASNAGVLGTKRSQTTLSAGWTSIVTADFTGDGKDELAFYNAKTGGYAVYATNSDGSLASALSTTTLGTGWTSVVASDVTGDGHPELTFYNATNGAYAVYAATAAGALDTRLSATTLSKDWSQVQSVQATGTGTPQLAFYNHTSGAFSIYAVDATGALGTLVASYTLQ